MRRFLFGTALALAGLAFASGASATTIYWTDWTVENPASMTGTITAPGGTVNITYTGPLDAGPSQTSCGTTWWLPGN